MAAKQERPIMDPKSGYCRDNGIYYSKRAPFNLPPPSQHLDVTSYIFSHHHHTQQIAFIDASSGLSLSYLTLLHNVRALAAGLHGLGIRKGDVVLVISPNSIALPSIYLAILSIGAILSTNPISTEAEIKKQVEDSKPSKVRILLALLGGGRLAAAAWSCSWSCAWRSVAARRRSLAPEIRDWFKIKFLICLGSSMAD